MAASFRVHELVREQTHEITGQPHTAWGVPPALQVDTPCFWLVQTLKSVLWGVRQLKKSNSFR